MTDRPAETGPQPTIPKDPQPAPVPAASPVPAELPQKFPDLPQTHPPLVNKPPADH